MHDRLTGVGTVGTLPDDVEPEAAVLVEACAYGWWYTAPVPNRGMIAVLVSDGDLIAEQAMADPDRWAALLADTTYTRERVAGAQFPDAPRGLSSGTLHVDRITPRLANGATVGMRRGSCSG